MTHSLHRPVEHSGPGEIIAVRRPVRLILALASFVLAHTGATASVPAQDVRPAALCVLSGPENQARADETRVHRDGTFLPARQITRVPAGDSVCCVRDGRRSRSSAGACRRALGTVKPLQECAVRQSPFGCCKLGIRTYKRTSEVACRQQRGQMVSDTYCHVHEPVCCLQVSRTGRRTLFETTRSRCRGAGGRERPGRECSAGSFQGDPAFRQLQTQICCRTPTDIFRITSIGCFSAGGRVVDGGYCGTRSICCRQAGGGHLMASWSDCRRSGGSLAEDWACRR